MYSIKNTTDKPVRPIGIMVGTGEAPDGSSCRMVAGDVPTTVSDAEYSYAKEAIQKYVKHGMLKCEKLSDDKKKDATADSKSEKDELEVYAKEKFGVDLDKRKGLEKLKAEVAELEAGAED